MKKAQTPDAILASMAATFKERGKIYGQNYIAMGAIMRAFFPNGIVLKTEEDFIQFHLLDWAIGKLSRFATTGRTHKDSIHDAAVYLAMLESRLK